MKVAIAFLFCLLLAESLGKDRIKCFQCVPSTEECDDDKASQITCGSPNAKCALQVRKDDDNRETAIRKCVIEDPKTNKVLCPDNYECEVCDTDLCNTATLAKFAWPTVIGVVLATLYL